MKVALFGGTGFVGNYLISELLDNGYQVNALIRPGRVDLKQYIGHCSHIQCIKMFENFYPDHSRKNPNLPIEFAERVINLGIPVSAAQVQGLFMFFKHEPHKAMENVFRFQGSGNSPTQTP